MKAFFRILRCPAASRQRLSGEQAANPGAGTSRSCSGTTPQACHAATRPASPKAVARRDLRVS